MIKIVVELVKKVTNYSKSSVKKGAHIFDVHNKISKKNKQTSFLKFVPRALLL
jgi:hypothetical protein